jgi:glycosyltransferase involved in cell wall biosynthesis
VRLTIVCPSGYPVLQPGAIDFAGGAEFQQLLLARAMRARGHEVSWVVGDYGQPEQCEIQGFAVHRSFALGRGNRRLRFVPDMASLRRALRRTRPDLVNQRSTSFYTGQLCYFAHELDAAFTFSIGIDYNCHRNLLGRAPKVIQELYRYGIRHAEMVLAQTQAQSELMRANFAVECEVLPNLLELPPQRAADEPGGYVLWVGSLAKRKRPELFLELARRLPELPCRLVGGPGEDRGYDREIAEQARGIANLEMVGFVPPDRMDAVYRGARVYVNTSRLEGLPNAFLQSWSHGVPAVTLDVDPDHVIRDGGLGAVARDADDLTAQVRALYTDAARWQCASRAARAHVEARHDVRTLGDRAEALLDAAWARRKGHRDPCCR